MIRAAHLRKDKRGATVIEFAMISPVFFLLIMGLCELTYQAYVQSILTGAVQKAGRDSTVEKNDTAAAGKAIDDKVMAIVWKVAKNATYTSSRKSYVSFTNINGERYIDSNGNDQYDEKTECFYDVNNNNTRDTDVGTTGQGKAGDVVVYTMQIKYARLFPLAKLFGIPAQQTLQAETIFKNQPYKQQANSTNKICPSES